MYNLIHIYQKHNVKNFYQIQLYFPTFWKYAGNFSPFRSISNFIWLSQQEINAIRSSQYLSLDLIRFAKILQDLASQDFFNILQNLVKNLTRSYKDLTKILLRSCQHLDKILQTSFQDFTKIIQDLASIFTRSYQHLSKILPRSYKILPRSYKILPASSQDLTNIFPRSYQDLDKILPKSYKIFLIRFFLGSYKIFPNHTRFWQDFHMGRHELVVKWEWELRLSSSFYQGFRVMRVTKLSPLVNYSLSDYSSPVILSYSFEFITIHLAPLWKFVPFDLFNASFTYGIIALRATINVTTFILIRTITIRQSLISWNLCYTIYKFLLF